MSIDNPSATTHHHHHQHLTPPGADPGATSWSKAAAPSIAQASLSDRPSDPPARPGDDEIEPLRSARRNATSAFERKYLELVLSRSHGSISRAAALSKVSRQMLQKLMRKHGVTMPR